jgi:membrane-associated phospholipid phosphatase
MQAFPSKSLPHAKALRPLPERLGVFALWGTFVGIAFFAIYPTTNWLSAGGDRYYSLFLAAELRIPFLPQLIWLYLSMYVLFLLPPFLLDPQELRRLGKELIAATCVSGAVFLAFPAKLGFARILPEEGLYRGIFEGMFQVDPPFNLVPSLHVVYTTAIGLALIGRAGALLRLLLCVWLALVLSSTVLVHQHHLLDVATGIALVLLMRRFLEKSDV